jgi:hypothetical protein
MKYWDKPWWAGTNRETATAVLKCLIQPGLTGILLWAEAQSRVISTCHRKSSGKYRGAWYYSHDKGPVMTRYRHGKNRQNYGRARVHCDNLLNESGTDLQMMHFLASGTSNLCKRCRHSFSNFPSLSLGWQLCCLFTKTTDVNVVRQFYSQKLERGNIGALPGSHRDSTCITCSITEANRRWWGWTVMKPCLVINQEYIGLASALTAYCIYGVISSTKPGIHLGSVGDVLTQC